MNSNTKLIAKNPVAYHNFNIEDKYEAGIVLSGTEIKSIRKGKVNLKDSYAGFKDGECYIYSMHISPYEHGNIFNKDPLRDRKLLLNKRELNKLFIKVKQDGEYIDDFDIEFNKIEDKKNEKTYEIKLKRLKVDGKFKIKMDEGTLIDEGGLENNLFEVDVYLEMENVEEKDNYLKDEIKEEKIEKSEEFEYENDEEQFEDI